MANYQLDLTAYQCPMPLLATKKALAELAEGDSLNLMINTSTSLEDLELLCETLGYQLSLMQQTSAEKHIQIQK